ncbi:hypothetical protein, partial [Psychroserpens sp.]|uniref:hypothetical protein n=1 Tax=Psychroserpens sp. TaxID=2020870 RepID=UPI003C7841A7
GKISDSQIEGSNGRVWQYGELVQYAQEKFVKYDQHASIVRSTKYYNYSDPFHYNSDGFIDLGVQFANAMLELMDH